MTESIVTSNTIERGHKKHLSRFGKVFLILGGAALIAYGTYAYGNSQNWEGYVEGYVDGLADGKNPALPRGLLLEEVGGTNGEYGVVVDTGEGDSYIDQAGIVVCLQAGVKLDLRGPNEDEGTVLTAKDLIEELAYGQGVITTVEEICDKVERELNGDDGQFQPDVPMPTIPDDRAMSL